MFIGEYMEFCELRKRFKVKRGVFSQTKNEEEKPWVNMNMKRELLRKMINEITK